MCFKMVVSIIIPACNEEKYIAKTLKNIPNKYETIVVCNGCTDKTEEVVKKFPVKLISIKKKGTSHAKNFGAKNASNEMLLFLDADIVINEKIIKAIEKTKFKHGCIKLKPNINKFKAKMWIHLRNLGAKYFRGGGAIFCKKDLFEKIGGFEENLSYREDARFQNKAKKLGKYGLINEYGIVNMRRQEKEGYLKHLFTIPIRRLNKQLKYPIIR